MRTMVVDTPADVEKEVIITSTAVVHNDVQDAEDLPLPPPPTTPAAPVLLLTDSMFFKQRNGRGLSPSSTSSPVTTTTSCCTRLGRSCPALFTEVVTDPSSSTIKDSVSSFPEKIGRRKLAAAGRGTSRSCCYLPGGVDISPTTTTNQHSKNVMPGSRLSSNYADNTTDIMIRLNGCALLDECQSDAAAHTTTTTKDRDEIPGKKKLPRYRSLSMSMFEVDSLPTMSNSSSGSSCASMDMMATSAAMTMGTRSNGDGDCSDWKAGGSLNALSSSSLMKSVSTPEIASAETPSPHPEGQDLIDLESDCDYASTNASATAAADSGSSKNIPGGTPPTHVMIRELIRNYELAKYQGHILLGLAEGREDAVTSSSSGHRISLSEALHDLPVTSKTLSTTGRGDPHFPNGTASLPRLSTSSSLLIRKKSDKKTTKLIRRSSNIFSLGKSKKSKDEVKRCQLTHSFVSVSFSNAAPCQICGKPLAHKAASQCQNCFLACHDHSGCFDQIEACPCAPALSGSAGRKCLPGITAATGITPHHQRSVSSGSSGIVAPSHSAAAAGEPSSSAPCVPFAGTVSSAAAAATSVVVPSVVIDTTKLDKVMMDVHGYAAMNVRQQDVTALGLFPLENSPAPSVKRLSVPSSFESQTAGLGSAHSESSLSPGKPSSTDSHADYDSPAEDNSSADNPPDGRDLLSHARLLDFDPSLKLATLEPENWQAGQEKEYLATLTQNELKRQGNIYELIKTEKEHCTKLLIIGQIYIIKGMREKLGWTDDQIHQVFPCLEEISQLHVAFLQRLRKRQDQDPVVATIGDVLIEQFSGDRGDMMKRTYAGFCGLQKVTLKKTKEKLEQDRSFKEFHKEQIDLLKCRSGTFDIPSCYAFITYRMTKYELLVKEILKHTEESNPDYAVVIRAHECIKEFLSHVNRSMAIAERRERLAEIYKQMELVTTAVVDGETWKKHNLLDRVLLYEGTILSKDAKKPLRVLLLNDAIVFLQDSKNSQKLSFAQFVDKKPPVIYLDKVYCMRVKPETSGAKEATLMIIKWQKGDKSPSLNYEITCTDPKEREKWQVEIENAKMVLMMHSQDGMNDPLEEDFVIDEAHLLKIRETISACEEKDADISRLCQEKSGLIERMIDYAGIPRSRMHLPPLLTVSEENPGTEQMQATIKAALLEVEKLASLPCAFSPTNQAASDDGTLISQASSGTGNDLILPPPPADASPGHKRHGTFNGFDGSKEAEALRNASRSTSMKDQNRSRRPPLAAGSLKANSHLSKSDKSGSSLGVSSLISSSRDSCGDYSSSSAISSSPGSSPRASTYLADEQASVLPSALQLQWYLNQLSDAVARQSTAFESLNAKFAESQHRVAALEASKKVDKHSETLETLRRLQESFSKEKSQYFADRDAETQELKRQRQELDRDAAKLKTDTMDIERQRNAMFIQCDKLREAGLEVKLSTAAPYVQIFQCQPTLPVSAPQPLPPPPHYEDRKPPVNPYHQHLVAPLPLGGSYVDGRALPPLPSVPSQTDHRARPLLASSQSLNPIRIPVAPPMPAVIPAANNQLLRPTVNETHREKSHSPFSISNWRGSMESLVQKTGASAKDKMRSLYDGQDKTDSTLPRPHLRAASEAKLGIGISNLMHLSEKTSVVAGGKEQTPPAISPASSKKKSSDKKRTFL
ncbi:putative Rho guanine nucleotide exchange factor 18 [Hypsibius exemplaris]|uniref:Rho guanine nucleotide exchange factor 18 n=1 Tax=Hypsibius exemplaris TaxID=2072580 RepID=A0A1W0X4P5_HYPEX|nr:putative Rho guanine nucleotide exchange factor 18 [Hypsibius exemplaris]